jgi:hypothetical protein
MFAGKGRLTGKYWYLRWMKIRCSGKNSMQFVTLLLALAGLKERRPNATPWSSGVGIHDSPDGLFWTITPPLQPVQVPGLRRTSM